MAASDEGGRFAGVTLNPQVTLAGGDEGRLAEIHKAAHRRCFIANSVNFPVRVALR